MDLISVIIPVYNVEKYLKECLDSIINQTYKNLEVILVDDGSTDKSGEICDLYSKRKQNFKVIHKKNEGLGMARNSGLEAATGEYVYFFDSDDYIRSDEIEFLHKSVKRNDVDVCLTGYISVDDKKNIINKKEYKDNVYPGDKANTVVFPKMLGSLADGSDRIEMSASAQLYSMKPIRKYDIKFVSERDFISEDLIFNWDYLQYANGVCTVNRVGNYYRCNPESLTHKYRENRFEEFIHFYLYVLERLKKMNYGDEAVLRHTKNFFISLRSCIIQESSKDSLHGFKEKLMIIKKYCENNVVRDAIKLYPIKQLGIKQQIFLFLVRYKCALLLMIFSK